MSDQRLRPLTQLVHAGERRPGVEGAVALPIFQSSTFEYEGQQDYHALRYIRLSNTPNHEVLHAKLAALEQGEAALVTASGMAAISSALLSVVSPGDHVLADAALYGGTHAFITEELARWGVEHTFVDTSDPDAWDAQRRPNTRVFYTESVSNPLLRVPDHRAVVQFARRHDLVSIVDNTFLTPLGFRPLELGYDLSVHSCTKYLNGHSDVVAGAVIGTAQRVDAVNRLVGHLGGCLDPHACFLLHRGIKTLGVRLRQQFATAQAVAEYLQEQSAVTRMLYPGLEDAPGHQRARELFEGYGAMVAFDLQGGAQQADRVMKRVRLPVVAPSLGGVESLITRPATTSHSAMTVAQRQEAGIGEGLVRLSVGLEEAQDLIDDLEQALLA